MTHVQGPVPLGDDSYIKRPFEQNVIRELMSSRWVLLLGPRQHGKTSALIRVREILHEGGLLTALVDLQAAPPTESYEGFVSWFSCSVCEQLNTSMPASVEQHDLGAMLGAALPEGNSPAVILIDEASNIKDAGWRNAFYGQLRAISSRRAVASPSDAAARLRFIFAGTFRPETLIDEANSPFNVCERFDTEDLTASDVDTLAAKTLGEGHQEVGPAIFDEVGGQPFLVQKLLGRVQGADDLSQRLNAEIAELRTGQSDHVGHLFGKVLAEPKLSTIASRMVSDGAAPIEAADPDYRYMQVLGIARRNGGNIEFRNSLYAHVAASSPQLGGTADAHVQVPMFPLPMGAFSKVQSAELREIAWSAHTGGIAAYRAGCNRLALAGFGGSLEALLLDLMSRQDSNSLPAIIQQAGCTIAGRERVSDPSTWTLFNLIKAAHAIGGAQPIEPPQALREWRNNIHPAVARQNYRPDSELEPEARAAATLHEITLRDLP
jgi:hypothetical protein